MRSGSTLDYAWQDDQFALANTEFGEAEVASFGLLNARISLADHTWQFAPWSRNLTDEDSANYQIGSTSSTYLAPLMYGAEVIFDF